jgi:DNA-binding transcriptional regulator YiaG
VKQVEVEEHALFRGVKVTCTASLQKCAECGLELAGIEESAVMQEWLVDACRKAAGLLGSDDICSLRQEKGLSQKALADALDVR